VRSAGHFAARLTRSASRKGGNVTDERGLNANRPVNTTRCCPARAMLRAHCVYAGCSALRTLRRTGATRRNISPRRTKICGARRCMTKAWRAEARWPGGPIAVSRCNRQSQRRAQPHETRGELHWIGSIWVRSPARSTSCPMVGAVGAAPRCE